MDDSASQAELLRRLEREHARFAAALARLTPAQMDIPDAIGEWSVKDLLAHLIAHEGRALQELRYALRGERLAIDHAATDSFNAGAIMVRRADPADEVRAAWERSYRRVVAMVAALSGADFDPEGATVAALGDTIDGALGNNTYGHYAEHLGELEGWVRRVGH